MCIVRSQRESKHGIFVVYRLSCRYKRCLFWSEVFAYRILTNGLLIQAFADTSLAGGAGRFCILPLAYKSNKYKMSSVSLLDNGGLISVVIKEKKSDGFFWGQGQGNTGWFVGVADFITIGF